MKLCFRPLLGFVIPQVKKLGGGGDILELPCPSVSLFVSLSAGICTEVTPQPFVSKPDMVVHRPEPVCHAQELGCYL